MDYCGWYFPELKDSNVECHDVTYMTQIIHDSSTKNKREIPNPKTNLYWGCAFGIRTYFKNSREWKLISSRKSNGLRLERLVFKRVSQNYYLVADAYDGEYIERCTRDFLSSCSGQFKDPIQVNNATIGIGGNSKLLAYTRHDGLMDFQITDSFLNTDQKKRSVIILACYSRNYFSSHLLKANVNPLVWTTGLMCPEAYTVHDATTYR